MIKITSCLLLLSFFCMMRVVDKWNTTWHNLHNRSLRKTHSVLSEIIVIVWMPICKRIFSFLKKNPATWKKLEMSGYTWKSRSLLRQDRFMLVSPYSHSWNRVSCCILGPIEEHQYRILPYSNCIISLWRPHKEMPRHMHYNRKNEFRPKSQYWSQYEIATQKFSNIPF